MSRLRAAPCAVPFETLQTATGPGVGGMIPYSADCSWGSSLPGSSVRLLSHPAPSKLFKRGAVHSKGCAPDAMLGGAGSGANHRPPSRQVPEGQGCFLVCSMTGHDWSDGARCRVGGSFLQPYGAIHGSGGGGVGRTGLADEPMGCSFPRHQAPPKLLLGCPRLSPDCFTDIHMDPTETFPCPTSLGLTAKTIHGIHDSRAPLLGNKSTFG